MKKTSVLSLLMLLIFTVAGCSGGDSNSGIHLNNDGNVKGSMNDSDSNSEDCNRITGTDVFVEKTFVNVYEVSSFFSKLNIENGKSFIIPNYSCQNEYDFYYYFKGTCSGESYEKNSDNVEYINYIFGGVLYSIDEQGEKRIVYSFDVLEHNVCYHPEADTIEYVPQSNSSNNYVGYLNGIAIIKLRFEIESDNYTEIINETMKSYCIIDRGDNM